MDTMKGTVTVKKPKKYRLKTDNEGFIIKFTDKDIAEGETIKNLEALANPDSLNQFKNIKELRE